MEKQRNIKILSIIALVIAITGMSLGFAAFSTTLNISSSASVSPNSDDFKVMFCDFTNVSYCNSNLEWSFLDSYLVSDGASANGGAMFSTDDVDDIGGTFTAPNQKVVYKIYIHNVGEYDAYLRGITFTPLDNGSYKKCSATTSDSTKATDSLVQAACDGIKVSVSIGGKDYELGNDTISDHLLAKGTYEEVFFTVEYLSGAALADGPFKVDMSSFKLNYSTVDAPKLITFTVDGASYQAEEGMTWEEWVNSSYNTVNALIIYNKVIIFTRSVENVNTSDLIVDGGNYSLSFQSSGGV